MNTNRNRYAHARPLWVAVGLIALGASAFTSTAWSYGNEGHEIVGAIADRLIAGTNAEKRVKELLGSETLEHASTWADEVKHGPKTEATKAYAARNKSHGKYHYTDIPLQEKSYSKSSVGADSNDVVQALRRCIVVLEGGKDTSVMTQKEALKVLVHLVGDIHQPLHVGAAYLDEQGNLILPKTKKEAEETMTLGGGWITFHGNMHSYWDSKVVDRVMSDAGVGTPRAMAKKLTANAPAGWQSGSWISQWGTQWANEMMPLSREAHSRLTIGPRKTTVKWVNGKKKTSYSWPAKASDDSGYATWSAGVVKTNLARGGYRLAALLQKIWK